MHAILKSHAGRLRRARRRRRLRRTSPSISTTTSPAARSRPATASRTSGTSASTTARRRRSSPATHGRCARTSSSAADCILLRPGNYPSLRAMGLNNRLSSAREADRNARYSDDRYAPAPMPGEVTFYQDDYFRGRAFSAQGDVADFHRFGYNDRASSAVVLGTNWEVCSAPASPAAASILRPGRYPNLGAMGLQRPHHVGAPDPGHRAPTAGALRAAAAGARLRLAPAPAGTALPGQRHFARAPTTPTAASNAGSTVSRRRTSSVATASAAPSSAACWAPSSVTRSARATRRRSGAPSAARSSAA